MDYSSISKLYSLHINKIITKYRTEVTLLGLALIIMTISIILTVYPIFASTEHDAETESITILSESNTISAPSQETTLYIDVSGAVNSPDVYKVSHNTRLHRVIDMAGGLSEEADKEFVSRNYNMAKTLYDQEKIYIPTRLEIQQATFIEPPRILEYLVKPTKFNEILTTNSPTSDVTSVQENDQEKLSNSSDEGKININTATAKELETLPRIGKVTAEKIINNRPYSNILDLKDKKIVFPSTFEAIQDLISI